MNLTEIKTRADVVTYVREQDTDGWLLFHEAPEALLVYYIANYEFRKHMTSAQTIRDYLRVIEEVFDNKLEIREGFGGLVCDNGTSLFTGIMAFNVQEECLEGDRLEHANKVMKEVFPHFEPYN